MREAHFYRPLAAAVAPMCGRTSTGIVLRFRLWDIDEAHNRTPFWAGGLLPLLVFVAAGIASLHPVNLLERRGRGTF
jgi:hypothetical protein